MKFQKYYNVLTDDEKALLNRLAMLICSLIGLLIFLHIDKIKTLEETTKAFKNSEVLVCHDTLIVSDSNWKLVDNHLINNNSAGYLLIDKCQIKKD